MAVKSKSLRSVIFLVAFAGLAAAQAPPAAPATGPSAAIQTRVAPPARITSFTAKPESIQPGQPVSLVWTVENPSGITLEPGIGRVTPRGTRQVFPAATTTYTLTVRGPNNTTLVKSVTVNVAGTTAATASAAEAKKEVPRTADGKPDRAAIDAIMPTVREQLGILDKAVARTGYLVDDRFTFADINLMPILYRARQFPESAEALAAATHLAGYSDRHAARPSFVNTSPPSGAPSRSKAN